MSLVGERAPGPVTHLNEHGEDEEDETFNKHVDVDDSYARSTYVKRIIDKV